MDLLLLHAALTWLLVGLIWVVQLVLYPQFAQVGAEAFPRYHADYCRRIGWVVAPAMGLELVTGVALLFAPPEGVANGALWLGAALLAINWGNTALLAVPLHRRLGRGFDDAAWRRLVAVNWIRTASFSARGVLVAVLLA